MKIMLFLSYNIFQFKCTSAKNETLRHDKTNGWGKKTNTLKSTSEIYINLVIGFLHQYRTINCTWGGNPCLGYTNEKEVQKQRRKITYFHISFDPQNFCQEQQFCNDRGLEGFSFDCSNCCKLSRTYHKVKDNGGQYTEVG